MRTYTFVLGGLLGALGGILVTPLIGVDYQLGLNLTLKGFAAARGLDLNTWLDKAGIDPTRRAEEIEVAGFVSLARGVRTGTP